MNSLKAKYGEDNINYIQSSSEAIFESIKKSDLVVGSVYVIGKEAPKIITREMIGEMSPGTVMVDISIDQHHFSLFAIRITLESIFSCASSDHMCHALWARLSLEQWSA